MEIIIAVTFALFILLGYEIRYRLIKEELDKLQESSYSMQDEILQLKSDIKKKQDAFQEFK